MQGPEKCTSGNQKRVSVQVLNSWGWSRSLNFRLIFSTAAVHILM